MTDQTLLAAHQLLASKAVYDREYAAAECILRSPLLRWNSSVWRHVDDAGIDFKAMLARRGWSSAERHLLRAAWSLFNGDADVNLGQLVGTLSRDNMSCVLKAIGTLAGVSRATLA